MTGNKPCDSPCMRCGNPVREDDDFCASCGTLIAADLLCQTHPGREAVGACVVCGEPCCQSCGMFVHGVFYCNAHVQAQKSPPPEPPRQIPPCSHDQA